jgi:hypothetical protein
MLRLVCIFPRYRSGHKIDAAMGPDRGFSMHILNAASLMDIGRATFHPVNRSRPFGALFGLANAAPSRTRREM